MTPTTLPGDAVLVALVAIVVQVVKPVLEIWLAPTNPAHDPVVRLFAMLLGVGLMLLQHGVPRDGPGWVTVLGYGLGTALAAIGTYHLLTGSASPPPILLSVGQKGPALSQDAPKGSVGL